MRISYLAGRFRRRRLSHPDTASRRRDFALALTQRVISASPRTNPARRTGRDDARRVSRLDLVSSCRRRGCRHTRPRESRLRSRSLDALHPLHARDHLARRRPDGRLLQLSAPASALGKHLHRLSAAAERRSTDHLPRHPPRRRTGASMPRCIRRSASRASSTTSNGSRSRRSRSGKCSNGTLASTSRGSALGNAE